MAKRLQFLRPFDFRVKRTLVVAFRAGSIVLAPDAAARAALASGAAVLVEPQTVMRPMPDQSFAGTPAESA